MLTRSGYEVDKSTLQNELLIGMRKELTVSPMVERPHPFAPPPPKFRLYQETMRRMCVPRYYAELKGFPRGSSERLAPEARTMRFSGTLKDATRQNEAATACEKAFSEHGGGILSLPTGFGKTTVALNLACRLGLKTLVVAHKEFLADQWIERIQQFVPGAKIGRIQADVCDVEDKDFVVGMLQSLSMKDYPPEVFAGMGLLIIDEVHHVSAPVFSRCLLKACCPYMLGLSATPHRKDGLFKVIEWCIGPLCFSVQRENQKQVVIETLTYRCDRYKQPLPSMRGMAINMAKVINDMCADPERNKIIVDRVRECLGAGRQVIVLSDRRGHCEHLTQTLGNSVAGLYIGGSSQETLKKAETKDVILATYSLANEGLDIPKLDTLILATPKSDVVQSVGRILRENHTEQKKPPLVVDIIDDHGVFYAQYNKRKLYYTQAGFVIQRQQYIEADDVDPPLEQHSAFLEDS